MGEFVEPPPPSAQPPSPTRFRMPPWFGAPHGTLPGVVDLELVVARTEKVAVCVGRIAAYAAGFELELATMTSPDCEGWDPGLFGPRAMRLGHGVGRGDRSIPEGMLRFGVQFADGSKATNTASTLGPPELETEPSGPCYSRTGAEAAGAIGDR